MNTSNYQDKKAFRNGLSISVFKCAQKVSKTGYFFTSLRHGIYFF